MLAPVFMIERSFLYICQKPITFSYFAFWGMSCQLNSSLSKEMMKCHLQCSQHFIKHQRPLITYRSMKSHGKFISFLTEKGIEFLEVV